MKTIAAFTRRADISRPAFRDYYETRHAVLGMTHFPFTKYVRNHVVDSAPTAEGVDCISEFYVDDWEKSAAATKAETGEMFAEDEARFMDRSRIRSAVVEESVLQGAPRAVDRQIVQRRILGFDLAPGPTGEDFARALTAWASSLAAESGRITLDRVVGPVGDSFPYDRLFPWGVLVSVWAPEAPRSPLPAAPERTVLRFDLLVDVCETPPETLVARSASSRATPTPSPG